MADADYRRLGAACHCGEPVKLWNGRGRRPRYCDSHTGPPRPAAKEQKQCPACRGIFVSAKADQVYCTRACGYRTRRGNKPRNEIRNYTCAYCGNGFQSTHSSPMYCGKACKVKACIARDPARKVAYAARARVREQKKAPQLCAYFAKTCERCSKADGRRQEWALCRACKRADALAAGREASLALNEAKHKAAGREVECDECGAVYCPLYGRKHGAVVLCIVCSPIRFKAQRASAKAMREAIKRGAAGGEHVDPFEVFERDGWMCRLCGIDTPKSLRGTYEHNAPELDHAQPVTRGGQHTYANTQCLCRSCNVFKGARTMAEVLAVLAA